MPDDNGMETIRSDAPSADESLFSDAAGDTEAAAAQEEDSNNAVHTEQDADRETEQAAQAPDDVEKKAIGDDTEKSEDLKVVVSIKGGRATIGVQQPSADPHIETFYDPDLAGLTQEVPAVVERARARWEDEPKHPAYERPASPARRRNRHGRGAAQGTATSEGGAEQQQQTLRLF